MSTPEELRHDFIELGYRSMRKVTQGSTDRDAHAVVWALKQLSKLKARNKELEEENAFFLQQDIRDSHAE